MSINRFVKMPVMRGRKNLSVAVMVLAWISLMSIVSCASSPKIIEEDLSPADYFQKAQAAMVERNDYKTALAYYKAFLERYPEDIQNGVAAEYEIAFIYYKMGEMEESKRLFNELLARYEGDAAMVLPRWPAVLAKKILDKIEEPEITKKERGT